MSDISEEIEKFRQDLDACVAGPWINKSLLSILDSLAARVEAMEKLRQEESAPRCLICGGLLAIPVPHGEIVCSTCCKSSTADLAAPPPLPAASGGPQLEQGKESLMHNPEGTQCGYCGGAHEHYHDPEWIRAHHPPPREADAAGRESGQPQWRDAAKEKPARDVPVIIEGGPGFWDGYEWRSLHPTSYNRPIQWKVTHWLPLPPLPSNE